MCVVLAWNGRAPTGFMSKALETAEAWGKDSTGLAYRTKDEDGHPSTCVIKHATDATAFCKDRADHIRAARQTRGIAHTRYASLGMPVDNYNAHPFVDDKLVYAHNGAITNWRMLKSTKTGITTDSMVLGHYIKKRNFRKVIGAMGLVWMEKDNVYCMRYQKTLHAFNVAWSYTRPKKEKEKARLFMFTFVCTWPEVFERAMYFVRDNVSFDYAKIGLASKTMYQLKRDGIYTVQDLKVNKIKITDRRSSAIQV